MTQNLLSRYQPVAIAVFAAIVLVPLGHLELRRLEAGRLFAVSFPWDQAPLPGEIDDARQSARKFHTAAMVCIALFPFVAAWIWTSGQTAKAREFSRTQHRQPWWTILVVLFCLASATDLITTLAFFHRKTIELEVHPGIRLVSYAYGRTCGPLLAKGFQVATLAWLACSIPRWVGILILTAATLLAAAATLHNLTS